jgi:hypothetical protein
VEEIMFRAAWNGAVLAESDRTVKVEGNHHFPPESLHREYLTDSPGRRWQPWVRLTAGRPVLAWPRARARRVGSGEAAAAGGPGSRL